MYRHRPDVLSFTFGLAFLLIGLLFTANAGGIPDLEIPAVLASLAVAAGVGVIGSLAFGDVHARAGRRLAARQPAPSLPAPPPEGPPPPSEEELDALLGPPIDPEALDRAYRETFGDDDRYLGSSSGEEAGGVEVEDQPEEGEGGTAP